MNNTIHINSQYMNVRYTLTLNIVIIFEDKLNKLRGQTLQDQCMNLGLTPCSALRLEWGK